MREWLTHTDCTLAEIHADTPPKLERLDCEQPRDFKAEGLRLASNATVTDEVRSLPD